MIRLPNEDSKANGLDGFWQWVTMMAADDFDSAAAAVVWPNETVTGPGLRSTVTGFFGGDEPWSVVVPNDRLVGEINDMATWQPPQADQAGWLMAMVPLTLQPEDPKDDDIPLMGLATSFFLERDGDASVLTFEIFHA